MDINGYFQCTDLFILLHKLSREKIYLNVRIVQYLGAWSVIAVRTDFVDVLRAARRLAYFTALFNFPISDSTVEDAVPFSLWSRFLCSGVDLH
ncbi:hypothetical protein T09_10049 [Trichinella sp. T9]|nr:hypothetical protein T09_10049 [Trichinella sp. T9]